MPATTAAKPALSAAVRIGRPRRPRPPSATQARDETPAPALMTARSERCVSAWIHA